MKMKFNLATKITIARILLIVPTIAAFIVGQLFANFGNELGYFIGNVVAAALFAICCSTDFVDGYIARKTGTVTDLGKLLDPLADKVVIVIMLFLLVLFRDGLDRVFAYNTLVIAVLSGIILSRELLISVFRSIAASKNCVLAADIFGKIKTVVLDVAVTTLMLAGMHIVIGYIGTVLFYLGAALTVYSGVNYIVKNRHVFADNSESKEQDSFVAMNEQYGQEEQSEQIDYKYNGLSQAMYDEFENREENRELLDRLQMAKRNWDDRKIEEKYDNWSVNCEDVQDEGVVEGVADNNSEVSDGNFCNADNGSADSNKEFEKDRQMYEALKALIRLSRECNYISMAQLQRKLMCGYPKVAAIWFEFEKHGIIKESDSEKHTFVIAQDLDLLESLLQEIAPVYEDGTPYGDVE